MRGPGAMFVAIFAGFLLGWVARQPERVVPETVVRLVAGPPEVVEIPLVRQDPPSDACLAEDRMALAMLALPSDVPVGPPATESACRARIELAAALGTARQLDQIGRPRPFPADLPEKYREAGFTAVVQKVLAECPDIGLELHKVDCAEFPCLASFVGSQSPVSCDAWRAEYGDLHSMSSHVLVGADGERFVTQLVGPHVPDAFAPPDPDPPSEDGPFAEGNGMKRLTQRGRDAREAIIADLGARELTVEEQRDDKRAALRESAKDNPEGTAWMLEKLEAKWAAEDAAGR